MEEMVDIIKKINAIKELKNGNDKGLEFIEESNKITHNLDNEKRLKELMQELDETKDVYKRKELTEKIEQFKNKMIEMEKGNKKEPRRISREELAEVVQELNETKDVYKRKELTEKIEHATEDLLENLNKELDNMIEKKSSEFKKTIQEKKLMIESNKQDLYRLKNNRDMLSLHEKNDESTAWKKTYEMIGEEMSYKLKLNETLNAEIADLQGKLTDIENRNFEKIIKEVEEEQAKTTVEKSAPVEPEPTKPAPQEPAPVEPEPQETVPVEPEPTEPEPQETVPVEPEPTEPAPQEPAPVEPEPTEPAPQETVPVEPESTEPAPQETVPVEPESTEPAPQETVPVEPESTEPTPQETDQTEQEQSNIKPNNKLIIYPDRVEVNLPNSKFELSLENISQAEEETIKALSTKTVRKIQKCMHEDNTIIDNKILRGLLADEQKLNDYLDLCAQYSEKQSDIVPTDVKETFPEIEYNLKGIRKNKDMMTRTKLRMYKNAKDLEKMLTYYDMKDKVNIKIGLLDRVYLRIQDFISKRKYNVALLEEKADNNPKKDELKKRLTDYSNQVINEQEKSANDYHQTDDKGENNGEQADRQPSDDGGRD